MKRFLIITLMILLKNQISKENDKSRIEYKNGKKKYFKLFNEVKITKYIINKSLGNTAYLF